MCCIIEVVVELLCVIIYGIVFYRFYSKRKLRKSMANRDRARSDLYLAQLRSQSAPNTPGLRGPLSPGDGWHWEVSARWTEAHERIGHEREQRDRRNAPWDFPPAFEPPQRHYAAGAAYLRGQGYGRIRAVHGLERAHAEFGPLVVEAKLPQVGALTSTSYEGDGYLILRHPETAVVREALSRLVSLIQVEVGPP